jgi:hypothetical protein
MVNLGSAMITLEEKNDDYFKDCFIILIYVGSLERQVLTLFTSDDGAVFSTQVLG